jgi:type IV secretion system protein TrbD
MTLRTIPIRRCTHRENLILGCDRELVMISGFLIFAMVYTAFNVISLLLGVVVWLLLLHFLRLAARHDPKLRSVYLRHRCYQSYYAARSTPHRVNKPVRG